MTIEPSLRVQRGNLMKCRTHMKQIASCLAMTTDCFGESASQ
jgi:hypothetical protein